MRQHGENNRGLNLAVILVIFAALILGPVQTSAQESSGQFDGGSVKIGYDIRSCSGSIEGAVRYNSSVGIEFCDGSDWGAAGGGCPAVPSDCSTIGDVCTDGSIFGGFHQIGSSCHQLFVTDIDQSTGSAWHTTGGSDFIATDSYNDGTSNQSQILPDANATAFNDCDSLSRHSQTDWYLPSQFEMAILYYNQAAIDANAAGNFDGSKYYWTSTETTNSNAGAVNFNGNGTWNGNRNKTTSTYNVRCVRRN